MCKMLRFFLTPVRKRRLRVVSVVILLLRLLRDIEHDEMCSNEDLLESFDSECESPYACCKYNIIEEEYLSCEHAINFLDSAIDDLEYVY